MDAGRGSLRVTTHFIHRPQLIHRGKRKNAQNKRMSETKKTHTHHKVTKNNLCWDTYTEREKKREDICAVQVNESLHFAPLTLVRFSNATHAWILSPLTRVKRRLEQLASHAAGGNTKEREKEKKSERNKTHSHVLDEWPSKRRRSRRKVSPVVSPIFHKSTVNLKTVDMSPKLHCGSRLLLLCYLLLHRPHWLRLSLSASPSLEMLHIVTPVVILHPHYPHPLSSFFLSNLYFYFSLPWSSLLST